jgi:CHAT domain-containing protein
VKKTFLLLFLLYCNITFAQNQKVKEELLNSQLGEFQLQFTELVRSRGVEWFDTKRINYSLIAEALRNYDFYSDTPKIAVIFYHHQNDTLYIWSLTKKGIAGNSAANVPANQLKSIEVRIKRFFAQNANRGAKVFDKDGFEDNTSGAAEDAAAILFPESIISSVAGCENIIIIPSLNIATIPLYFLQPFSGSDDFLVDRMTITIAQSIDDLLNRIYYYSEVIQLKFAREVTFIPESPLIVGNPDFEACKTLFSQLPGAGEEADNTAKKFGVSVLSGVEAIKSEVLNRMVKSELVYFATHGVADSNDPLNASFLVLAGEKGANDCGKLTAKEIQELELKPDAVVVLSACQTGMGKTMEAGIVGLSRAFLIAGAGNVFMSLWDVDDKATQELMGYFVEELFKPQQFFPATSLRMAILRYKEKNMDPNAWAAFISMGIPYPSMVRCK